MRITKQKSLTSLLKIFYCGTVPWCLWNLAMFFWNRSLSIALYILAASNRLSLKSNEAGLYFLMGSLRQELYFWYLLDIQTMGSFDVIEISELSQSDYQFGSNRYYTSYYRNVF
jgi:NADH-quinone oxidoreductase subunit N